MWILEGKMKSKCKGGFESGAIRRRNQSVGEMQPELFAQFNDHVHYLRLIKSTTLKRGNYFSRTKLCQKGKV